MAGAVPQLLAGALGAAVFSQLPAFARQYLQRLGGHLAEAEARATQIHIDAASFGLSTDAYLARFLDSPAHALEGQRMQISLAAARSLREAHDALLDSPAWKLPITLVSHLDPALAKATLGIYEAALPLSPQGALYALSGCLIGIALPRGFAAWQRRFNRKKATP